MAGSKITPALKQEALEKLLTQCPHCQAKRDHLQQTPINQSQQAELVHIRCGACQGSVVALVFSTGPLISSIGLITDLSSADAIRLQETEGLSEDYLLGLHQWLHQPNLVRSLVI